MKSKKENKLTIVLVVFTAILSIFFYNALEGINMGLGYGKDTSVIIETKNPKALVDYFESNYRRYHDIEIKEITSSIIYFKTSGIVSIEDFTQRLAEQEPESLIRLSGSFGTNTSITNTESFVKLSLISFILVIFAFFIYQYNLVGWLYACLIVLPLTIAITVLNVYGIAFTSGLWMFLLLVMASYILLFMTFIQNHKKSVIQDFLGNPKFRKNIIIKLAYQTTILSILSLGLFFLLGYGFLAITIVGVTFTLSLNLELLISFMYFKYNFDWDETQPELYAFLNPMDKHYKKETSWMRGMYSIYARLILIVLVLGIGLVLIMRPAINYDTTYSNQGLLIMNDSSSRFYIEMEAELMELNLVEYQSKYGISEQEQTWFYFDEGFSMSDLREAANSFKNRLRIDTYVYNLPGNTYPLFSLQAMGLFLGFIILNILGLSSKKNKQEIGYALMTSGLSILLFILISYASRVKLGTVYAVGLLLLPFVVSSYLSFLKSKEQKPQLVKSVSTFGVIFAFISIPMLVVTPSTSTFNLVYLVGIEFISFIISAFIVYGIMNKRKRSI